MRNLTFPNSKVVLSRATRRVPGGDIRDWRPIRKRIFYPILILIFRLAGIIKKSIIENYLWDMMVRTIIRLPSLWVCNIITTIMASTASTWPASVSFFSAVWLLYRPLLPMTKNMFHNCKSICFFVIYNLGSKEDSYHF